MSEDQIIKDLRKSSTERIRIALRSYKESQFLDIRNWYDTSGKEKHFLPSKKGISIQLNLLPELKEAIEKAIEQAELWSVENE